MTMLDYDRLAADYALHRRVHPGVLRALVETARLGPGARVLEIGCGTGNYSAALAAHAGCIAWGVDPSEEMLSHARARLPGAIFAPGRAEQVPFADASFDLVFSVDVIHHVRDRAAAFREAARLLRPGGRACTVTDSERDIARRRPLSSHWPETVPVELARYPRLADLRALMEAAGFEAIGEEEQALAYELTDARAYRDRAYSSLHLIDDAAFRRGLARLEADLAAGPLPCLSLYTLLWGVRPGDRPGERS